AYDADALLFHLLVQRGAQIRVEAAEDLLTTIDERRLDAEAVEDVGELDGDVAAAGNRDGLRKTLQVERLAGGDAMLAARKRGVAVGVPARGDEDRFRGHGAVFGDEAHGVPVLQHGAALEDGGAVALEPTAVDGLQPRDLPVLVGDQRRP